MTPGSQPAADIASAGNGGEIMELVQQILTGEALQNTESKSGTADAASRKAKGRLVREIPHRPGVECQPLRFVLRLSFRIGSGLSLRLGRNRHIQQLALEMVGGLPN